MAHDTKMTGFRISKTEEEMILSAMVANGDDNIAQHIKRVYFEAINGERRESISSILEDIFLNVKYLREKENARPEENLMLQLLCGMYVMLRNSVNDTVKKEADEYIDVAEIQNFLKG